MISTVLKRIDKYLETDEAKEAGYTSRPDVIYESLRIFFKEKNTSTKHKLSWNEEWFSVIGFGDNRIILKDLSTEKAITITIVDGIPMCGIDSTSNCIHVNYCIENQNLWKFLRKNKVKITNPVPSIHDESKISEKTKKLVKN